MDTINNNPMLKWIEDAKVREKQYYKEHPDSLVLQFEDELRESFEGIR